MAYTGRTVIKTSKSEITSANILNVLTKAVGVHGTNRSAIDYLWKYYKGEQPILERTKEVRPEICNRIVENRANEIVSFKVGYLMGEPVQYVNRGQDDNATEGINQLNEYVFAEDKAAKDKELADWFTICGTAYRMVLPDAANEIDESPFEIYTLDPRSTFVVYWSGLGNKPLMGVTYTTNEDGDIVYSCYTKDMYYEVRNLSEIVMAEPHSLGAVPIVEYPANPARLGAFEIVLPLLDAINDVASNRIDGIEQFIQSLLMFKGVDADEDVLAQVREIGGIKVPVDGDVKYLVQELNQSQTQTLVDYMYQTVLTICGMPNRNGGSSTSDTGTAVIYRDGFVAAESRAKDSELMFKQSEKQFLRIAIRIANTMRELNLKLADIDIRFTRRNYENIQEKAQVLTMLLAESKVHPRLAFEHSGMFADPEIAYTQSMEYYEDQQKQITESLANERMPEDGSEEDGEPVNV